MREQTNRYIQRMVYENALNISTRFSFLELEEINEQTDHRHRDTDGRNLVQLDLSAIGNKKHAASLTSVFSSVSVNVSRRVSTLRREA